MQIHLRNEIDLGGQMEVIDQRFPVEVTEKNGHYYFVFTNDENEKVMIKSNSEELTMTRFFNSQVCLAVSSG